MRLACGAGNSAWETQALLPAYRKSKQENSEKNSLCILKTCFYTFLKKPYYFIRILRQIWYNLVFKKSKSRSRSIS